VIKPRLILRLNNSSIHELSHYRVQSPVNDQLRGNHERQRNQKSRVNLDIEKKGHWDATESGSAEKGENQQRHPTNKGDGSDSARDKFQAGPREFCPKVELVKRPPEH